MKNIISATITNKTCNVIFKKIIKWINNLQLFSVVFTLMADGYFLFLMNFFEKDQNVGQWITTTH